ncbi:MAG: hypothetical protein ACXABY_29335, partial [Candidatus Thorarchaeota archaeon]
MTLEIDDGGDLRGYAVLNPKTAKKLKAELGSIVVFEDPASSFWGAVQIRVNDGGPADRIRIDTLVL